MVVFRTEKGVPHVFDAYCPHLGANLGVGGIVRGDCIECPFHQWSFRGSDGECINVPYSLNGNRKIKQSKFISGRLQFVCPVRSTKIGQTKEMDLLWGKRCCLFVASCRTGRTMDVAQCSTGGCGPMAVLWKKWIYHQLPHSRDSRKWSRCGAFKCRPQSKYVCWKRFAIHTIWMVLIWSPFMECKVNKEIVFLLLLLFAFSKTW